MSATQTAIDETMLDGLKSLLGTKFNQLLSTYIADSQKRMDRLEKAVAELDFATINQEAHGLKGSSRNIGALEFAQMCEVMEQKGRMREQSDLEHLFASVQQQFAVVCQRLGNYS